MPTPFSGRMTLLVTLGALGLAAMALLRRPQVVYVTAPAPAVAPSVAPAAPPPGRPAPPPRNPWSNRPLDPSVDALAVKMNLDPDDLRAVVGKDGKLPTDVLARLGRAEANAYLLATERHLDDEGKRLLTSIFGRAVLRPYTFAAQSSMYGGHVTNEKAEAVALHEALSAVEHTTPLGPDLVSAAQPLVRAVLK